MNDSDRDIREVSDAFFKSLSEGLTNAELAKLEDILIHNQAARKHYYDLAYVSAALKNTEGILALERLLDFDTDLWQAMAQEEKTAPEVEIPKEKSSLVQNGVHPPQEKREISKFSIFTLIACAAAVLFGVVFLKIVDMNSSRVQVATLVDEIDVQWADSNASMKKGCRLWTRNGPLHLNKGIVELRYDNGVEVLVEGPAAFEIGQTGIFLDYGRTFCRVSESGWGFTVTTRSSEIVDLGTEFGAKAEIDGSMELHMIKGKAQLSVGSAGEGKLSQTVTNGTALSYSVTTHKLNFIPIQKNYFASQIDSKTKMVLRGYANPYEAAVAETRPTAYYRFEKGQGALGYDEISGSATICDFSEPITLGQGPAIDSQYGNQSLCLTGDAKSGIFLSDKAVQRSGGKALSISLWIRPQPGEGVRQNVICYTDSQKRTSIAKTNQIYLTSDNQAAFFVYNVFETDIPIPSEKWTNEARAKASGFDVTADSPLPVGQWSHVAACFSDKKIELYINGQLCGTKPIPVRSECFEGGIWGIGCSTEKVDNNYSDRLLSNYKGFVDEVSFYDRMLTAQDIRTLYDAAKPL